MVTMRLREQAAQLCSAYASYVAMSMGNMTCLQIAESIGVPIAATELVCSAWLIPVAFGAAPKHLGWALAECLLRTGWVPS